MAIILVVDDDETIRKVFIRLLDGKGHTVLSFEDARPALDEVDFSTVSLVVSDLQMPMPGDEFVKELKQRGIDVPVIILSGALDQDNIDILNSLGVQRIMPKPFRLVELLEAVEELI